MKLGINPAWVNYGQSDIKFGDLNLIMGSWFNVPPSVPGATADGGWAWNNPTLPPAGQTYCAMEGYTRPGAHVLTCEGTGWIRFAHPDLPGGSIHCAFGGKGEEYTLQLKTTARPLIDMGHNDATDPLRNLRLWAPGADRTKMFHPDYVASLRPFACLRSMDWLSINGSRVQTWEGRRLHPGYRVEDFIELCNEVGADCWMNIPPMVSARDGVSDYCHNLGETIATRLDPNLTCYLEFANEIWNYGAGFAESTNYVLGQAKDAAGNYVVKAPDGSTLTHVAQMYGYLANAAYEAVEAQVEHNKVKPKIVRVFAGQAGWLGNSTQITMNQILLHGFKWKVGALACAPYSGWAGTSPYTGAALANMVAAGNTVDAVGQYIEGCKIGIAQMAALMPAWKALADRMGVPLLYYEMAVTPDFGANKAGAAPIMQLIQSDPRYAALQGDFIDAMAPYAALGLYYAHCRRGIWGMIQDLDDATSQRARGVLAWAARHNGRPAPLAAAGAGISA